MVGLLTIALLSSQTNGLLRLFRYGRTTATTRTTNHCQRIAAAVSTSLKSRDRPGRRWLLEGMVWPRALVRIVTGAYRASTHPGRSGSLRAWLLGCAPGRS